jgi:glutathione S-transferase
MMRLYDGKLLAHPRRVTVYLAEKGLKIDKIEVDARAGATKTPEFLRKNPAGKLPVLELDDGSYLPESAVIVEYLEERFPTPPMIGTTPEERAQIRASERIAADIFAYLPLILLNTEEEIAAKRGVVRQIEVAKTLQPGTDALLDQLENRIGNKPFLASDTPSIADCTFYALMDTTYRLFQYRIPERLPKLRAWYERFSRRPSAQIQ